jgi:hypothetical protein
MQMIFKTLETAGSRIRSCHRTSSIVLVDAVVLVVLVVVVIVVVLVLVIVAVVLVVLVVVVDLSEQRWDCPIE